MWPVSSPCNLIRYHLSEVNCRVLSSRAGHHHRRIWTDHHHTVRSSTCRHRKYHVHQVEICKFLLNGTADHDRGHVCWVHSHSQICHWLSWNQKMLRQYGKLKCQISFFVDVMNPRYFMLTLIIFILFVNIHASIWDCQHTHTHKNVGTVKLLLLYVAIPPHST